MLAKIILYFLSERVQTVHDLHPGAGEPERDPEGDRRRQGQRDCRRGLQEVSHTRYSDGLHRK